LISPIIIIGMHRSGTTMLVMILMELGFFPGAKLDKNLESIYFIRLNKWVMRRAGGAWDYPMPTHHLLQDSDYFLEVKKILHNSLKSRSFAEYSGSKKDWIFNTKSNISRMWGWKDPRNTFTFPIWNSIFPKAKLIYIKRNGVDVASSLLHRTNNLDGLVKSQK